MDFKIVKELVDIRNAEISRMSEMYNIEQNHLKRLCQEIGFQTQYSYSEVSSIVANELANGLNFNQIIIKYRLDKSLI